MSDGGVGLRAGPRPRSGTGLGLPSDVDESGRQPAKALEIAQALIRQVFKKAIEIGYTIFQDCKAMTIHFRLPVEIKHRASADHGIQRHQLAFIRAGKLRPAVTAVFFPERGNGLVAHRMVPVKVKLRRRVTRAATLTHARAGRQACKARDRRIDSPPPRA